MFCGPACSSSAAAIGPIEARAIKPCASDRHTKTHDGVAAARFDPKRTVSTIRADMCVTHRALRPFELENASNRGEDNKIDTCPRLALARQRKNRPEGHKGGAPSLQSI
jgi:hypothetical protein